MAKNFDHLYDEMLLAGLLRSTQKITNTFSGYLRDSTLLDFLQSMLTTYRL